MADENKNENEEQGDFFEDDGEFGLPDLEYEALDGDGGETDEPLVEEIVPDAFEDALQEEEIEDSELGIEEEFDEDLGFDTELEDEMDSTEASEADNSSDEVSDDFYSEDDYGNFDASDSDLDEETPDSVFDSDDLDDDGFKDFETSDDASGSKGKFARIVIFGTVLFIGLAFTSWYAYNNWLEDDPKEVTKKETSEKASDEKETPEKASDEKEIPEKASDKKETPEKASAKKDTPEKASATAGTSTPQAKGTQSTGSGIQATKPAISKPVATTPGTVNALDARTGNTFVIIGSFLDRNTAMGYANKLASEGKSPSIILPSGNGLFSRVAIQGFPTVADAIQNLENYKRDYGQDVWVLKY